MKTQDYGQANASFQSLTLQVSSLNERMERYAIQEQKVRSEQDELLHSLKADDTQNAEQQIQKMSEEICASKHKVSELEIQVDNARRLENDLSANVNDCTLKLTTLETQISLLEKLLQPKGTETFSPVLDLVEAAPGYELALWAALGDELDAAIDEKAPTYWRQIKRAPYSQELPEGVTSLLKFVKAPSALSEALSQVGIVSETGAEKLQLELLPGQSLVTKSGDCGVGMDLQLHLARPL